MYGSDIILKKTCKKTIISKIIVSCIWVLGLLIGSDFAIHMSKPVVAMMHNAAAVSVSFLCLYLALFLPFFLSALIIRFCTPSIAIILVFIKALSFGFCACGIIVAFSSAGWLIRALLLFSDSGIIVFLIWFWIRNISEKREGLTGDLALCATASLLFTCVDYFVVSPFLVMLLNI